MKTITVHRVELTFTADQITHGTKARQVREALERINEGLQREPMGLGARLIAHPDEIEIEIHNT